MSELMEDVTTSQLAAAIQAASEEVLSAWQPEHGPDQGEFYRQVALRTQGHLRRCGAIGRIDKPTRNRVLAALERHKAGAECTGSVT